MKRFTIFVLALWMAVGVMPALSNDREAAGSLSPAVALEARFVRAEAQYIQGRRTDALAEMRQIANEAAQEGISLSPPVERLLRRYLEAAGEAPAGVAARPETDRIADLLQEERERERLRDAQSRTRARNLYGEAQVFYRQGRLAEAEVKLQQALQAWPDYNEATTLLNTVRGRLRVASPEVEQAFEVLGEQRRVQVQRQVAQIEQLIADAAEDIDATNYPLALAKLRMALDQAELGNLPEPIRIKYARELRERIELTQQAQAEFNQEMRRRQLREALVEEQHRQHRLDDAEAQRIGRMLAELQRQMDMEAYVKAIGVAESILAEETLTRQQRERVQTIRAAASSLHRLRRHEEIRTESAYQHGKRFQEMEEQIVPWHGLDDLRTYPSDWAELSRRRIEQATRPFRIDEDTPSELVRQRLQQPISLPPFMGENTQLSDVIRVFADRLNINVQERYDPNTLVTIDRIQNIRADVALEAILNAASPDLRYAIREGLLVIGDQYEEAITGGRQIIVIDIHDLIQDTPDHTDTPDFSIGGQGRAFDRQTDRNDTGIGGIGGGTGGFDGFGDQFGFDFGGGDDARWEPRTADEIMEDLLEMIRSLIDPDGWGMDGRSIEATQGKLIVVNTPENIQAVQDLLMQFRQAKDVMVNVDMRVLTATRTFLEYIGMDIIDFIASRWNPAAGDYGAHPNPYAAPVQNPDILPASFGRQRGPLGSFELQATSLNRLTTASRGVGGASLSGRAAIAPPSGFQPGGLSLTMRYVDDVTLGILIDAEYGSREIQVMRSPRLTLMNGQAGWIARDRQLIYTQNLRTYQWTLGDPPQVFVISQPLLGMLNTATMFQVRPIVSADRRYVRLQLTPSISILEDLIPYELPDGNALELPVISNIGIGTGALVPDKGTLVMGGLNQSFQVDMETTVPLLGRLPIIGRLMTRRGYSREKTMLALLVRAEIMLQDD